MMLRPTLTVFLPLFIPFAAALPSLSGVFECVHAFFFFFFIKSIYGDKVISPSSKGLRGWTRNF